MGKYPYEMIHYMCEALWNVNKKHMLKDPHTECKLKERTNHIAHYLEKLNRRKYPIEKKRKILSKPSKAG